MRKLLLVTALVISPLLCSTGFGQQTAVATLTNGGSQSISIVSGASFTLTLQVTTNFTSLGYTVFYQTGAASSGLFTLTARTNPNPFFTDPTTSDAIAFSGTNGVLMPSNARDLGYTSDTINNQPPGANITLQTVTVMASASLAPGTYFIFLDPRSSMGNESFQDVTMTGNMFTVTVIPEPTTVGLAVLGGALLLVMVWRRQRAVRA